MINAFIAITENVQTAADNALADEEHPMYAIAKAFFSHPDESAFALQCRERDLQDGKSNLHSPYIEREQWYAVDTYITTFCSFFGINESEIDLMGAWDFGGSVVMEPKASLIYYLGDQMEEDPDGEPDEDGFKPLRVKERTLENYIPSLNRRSGQGVRQI
jgi:hypothetical protein